MVRLNMSLRRVRNSSILDFCGTLFDYALPLIIGGAVGWLCAVLVGYSVMSKTSELQTSSSFSTLTASQKTDQVDNGLTEFIFSNPFAISPVPVAVIDAPQKSEPEVKGSLADALLMATFPELGIWIEESGKVKRVVYLSIGEDFDSYKLETVTQNKALFRGEDGNSVTKFLYFSPGTIPAPSRAAAARESEAGSRGSAPTDLANQVTAAQPGGKEGVVARDVVNKLLMNPFDEMSKFRIRPKFEGDQSVGIEVQWIQDDSIIGSLGVKENDVIKSVNGIPIKNMGDVANAINSLMNGTRFDVEVMRGTEPANLTYVVK